MKNHRLKSFSLIDIIVAIMLSGILVSSSYLMFRMVSRMQINKSNDSSRNFDLLNFDISIEQNFFYADSIYVFEDSLVFFRVESNSALKFYPDKILIYRNNRTDLLKMKSTFNTLLNEVPITNGKINTLYLKVSDSSGKTKLFDGMYYH